MLKSPESFAGRGFRGLGVPMVCSGTPLQLPDGFLSEPCKTVIVVHI